MHNDVHLLHERVHPPIPRPVRNSVRRAGLAIAACGLLGLAGCSSPEADASDEYGKINKDVEAFEQSGDRDALIRRREAAVVQCMDDVFGFTYLPVPPTEPSEAGVPDPDTVDYGLVDQYMGPATPDTAVASEPSAPTDPNEAALAAMSPADADAWRLAAYGVDRDYRDRHPGSTDARLVGCINAASAAVLGPQNVTLLTELAATEQAIAERADEDADFGRVVREHTECVAERGFGTSTVAFDPSQILLAEAQRLAPELASQTVDEVAAARAGDTQIVDQLRQYERSLFAADQACRTEVDLDGAREAAHERATSSYAAERANRFEAYRTMLSDVRKRAAAVTSGGEVHYDFSADGGAS